MSWVNTFVDKAMGRAPPVPVALKLPTCGGVFFIRTSAAKRAPVQIGSSANIAERLRELQTARYPLVRLVRYERIDDEAKRVARKLELQETFKRKHVKGAWFNASILKHLDHLEGKT